MNSLKTKLTALIISLLLAATILLMLPLIASGKEPSVSVQQPLSALPVVVNDQGHTTGENHAVTSAAATSLAGSTIISGTYAGTVAITEPVPLGTLDLVFTLSGVGDTLSGAVEPAQTLVYPVGVALQGNITGSIGGITPTFHLDSAVFGGAVSGREVQRSFTLQGEVLEDGQVLQGQYSEVISGFTPDPLTVRGIFMVVYSYLPTEATPIFEPTDFIYLPVVLRNAS